MPSYKFITNPEAVAFIEKVKSGEYFRIIKTEFLKVKWFFVGALILLTLLLAIVVGKRLSEKAGPSYIPPIIEVTVPTQETQKSSVFSALKRKIQEFSAQLPDPAIPELDNTLNLEQPI